MARTSIQTNAVDFDKRMKAIGARVYRRSNEGVKELASKILDSLVDNTPKKTGQAAANWQVGLGERKDDFLKGKTDYAGAKAEGLATIKSRKSGQSVNISNNTPYIAKLNNGSSVQAPAGFIEDAVIEAEAFVRTLKVLKDG